MKDNANLTKLNGAFWIAPSGYKNILMTGNKLVYFQRIFYVDTPSKLEIAISANNRYKLWVNGHRVEEGPCKGDRWRQFYDVVDISSFLVVGENVIAVEVLYFSPALYREGEKTGPISILTNSFGPMLVVKGECNDLSGNNIESVSTGDGKWYCYMDEAVTWKVFRDGDCFMPVGAFEDVDAIKLPVDWKTKPQHANGWEPAIKRFEPDGSSWGEFSPLPPKERSIPFLYHTKKEFKKEIRCSDENFFTFNNEEKFLYIPPNTKGFIELDAGELVTGNTNLKVEGGGDGLIRLKYAESYSGAATVQYRSKGVRDNSINMEIFGYEDIYRPSGAINCYEPFWWRTFRFVRIEVETGVFPLKIYKPFYIENGYPIEITSNVSSSCEWIKPLWDISIRTLKRCMHETYEDCPYYEQIQYAFDTRLEILFTYILSGDTRLAVKAIEDFHCSMTPEGLLQSRAPSDEPNIIPVFSLYWIYMLEDYYWQTGSLELPRRYRATIEAILDWFDRHVGSYGLIEKLYYWEFIDWAEEWQEERGFVTGIPEASKHGPVTTSNLVYAAALKCAAKLMSKCDRASTADDYLKRAEDILKNVEQYCWSEEKGMYREGPKTEEYTEHAQAWAVLSGLAEGEKACRILRNAISAQDTIRCTFVFSYFLFRAMESTGLYNMTLPLWDKWKHAVELKLTTWPEDITRQRSDCHAWGSLPIYEFVRCFVGVRPGEPGWSLIRIEPKCQYISDMKGNITTPYGCVEVEWMANGKVFTLKGAGPEGIPIEVILFEKSRYFYPDGGYFNIEISL